MNNAIQPYLDDAKKYMPGVMLATIIALASKFLYEHYGAPTMLFALLLGMAFHFTMDEGNFKPGIEFSAKKLLRIGVALLGTRVTLDQLFSLGFEPIMIVLICIPLTIYCGTLVAKKFGKDKNFGLLTGGSVAICGASAALAVSAVLPSNKDSERNTIFTVVTVTAMSTIAMIGYPILFQILGMNGQEVGILIGATIHDVAQVVGAGKTAAEAMGDESVAIVATYVKLLRVAMLPVVVIVLSSMNRSSGEGSIVVPWFAIGFVVLLLINSTGIVPDVIMGILRDGSGWLLVVAVSALGVKTSLKAVFQYGWQPIMIVGIETLILLAAAIVLIFLL